MIEMLMRKLDWLSKPFSWARVRTISFNPEEKLESIVNVVSFTLLMLLNALLKFRQAHLHSSTACSSWEAVWLDSIVCSVHQHSVPMPV